MTNARALRGTLTDPLLRGLPPAGGVDQWCDSTDLPGAPGVVQAAVDALTRPGA
ncbi:hypothetical protein ACIG5E_35535 [Kitasatospora sp. NPDC053057]|uniref:hypothetical protein n=1 Tax=Kitasatospora sp. NPDC053057 TaxID=3364062 RepID=UPI0037CAFB33